MNKDIRQTKQYANYLRSTGWIVETKSGVNYFIKKFLFVSFMKIQRPEKIDFLEIKRLQRKYRVFQTIIEPKNERQKIEAAKNGFRKTKSPFLPSKTLEINLTQSKQNILASFKKDARYALRKSENYDLRITSNANTKRFRDNWKASVNYKRYVISEKNLIALQKAFGKNMLMLECVLENKTIAGAIFLKAEGKAYYWQAFTSQSGREKMAQYKVVWEGLMWAKKRGAKVFDFEGIYDERFPNKKWKGFTHFKKSFGGKVVEYPGAYQKFRLPFFK